MPTEKKERTVDALRREVESCTIAISTDFSGLGVGALTELRRALRQDGVRYMVVKNRLAFLAADAADKAIFKEIIEGPTGVVFGYGDPAKAAKSLTQFITRTRQPMKVRGAMMGDRQLSAAEVETLTRLPPKDELVATLMGQLNSPVAGLVNVLNAPLSGLARVLGAPLSGLANVLQRRLEQVTSA